MKTQPRYSPGSPFSRKDVAVSPRYSPGSPFSKKDRKIAPRYSPGSPFSNKRDQTNIRSVSGTRFTSKDRRVSPRYSPGSPFSNKRVASDIRTTSGSPFSNKDRRVSPRYSLGSPFSNKQKQAAPRYSPGSPFRDMRFAKTKVRYSTLKHRFDVNERMKKQSRVYNPGITGHKGEVTTDRKWLSDARSTLQSWRRKRFKGEKVRYVTKGDYKSRSEDVTSWEGDYKEKWINDRSRHPSFKSRKANQDAEFLRESLRKWNIFWARLNGNEAQPDAVKDKISKPKFDRKEANIWND